MSNRILESFYEWLIITWKTDNCWLTKNSCNVSDVLPPHIKLGDDGIVHANEGSDQGVDEEYDGEPQPTRSN